MKPVEAGIITLIGANEANKCTADQILDVKPVVKKNRKGKLVVTDRNLSIEYLFNAYYWYVIIHNSGLGDPRRELFDSDIKY